MALDPLFELALSIKAAQRELERRSNEAMEPLGLTGAQADALVVLSQAGPLSLKELGDLLIAEAGHPSRLIDRLVDAGWVERRASDDDRRRLVLSLTADGRRVVKKIERARQGVMDLAAALVGDRDVMPTLELFREMLAYTPFGALIERRAALGR